MSGVFDDEELEPAQERRDTELTLGSGTLLLIFFGLVLICGLCFGLGYNVGHRGVKSATTATAATTTTTPADQEPLQASGSLPKPSAIAQDVVKPPLASEGPSAASTRTAQAAQETVPAATSAPSVAQVAPAQAQQSQVRPAFTPGANAPDTQQASSTVRPALAPAATIMVQVAAVANPDDAEVLLNALRKRNYPVTARHEPSDNLIHVRVGPFATRNEAEQWKMRLLNDGYNAIVQQ